jgi:hypothetical protein
MIEDVINIAPPMSAAIIHVSRSRANSKEPLFPFSITILIFSLAYFITKKEEEKESKKKDGSKPPRQDRRPQVALHPFLSPIVALAFAFSSYSQKKIFYFILFFLFFLL